VFLQS